MFASIVSYDGDALELREKVSSKFHYSRISYSSWAGSRGKITRWFDRKHGKKEGNHIPRTEGKRCSANLKHLRESRSSEPSSTFPTFLYGMPFVLRECLLYFGDLPETYELRKKFNCSGLRITALSNCNPITGFPCFNSLLLVRCNCIKVCPPL